MPLWGSVFSVTHSLVSVAHIRSNINSMSVWWDTLKKNKNMDVVGNAHNMASSSGELFALSYFEYHSLIPEGRD